MTSILDIHTHNLNAGPEAVVSVEPCNFVPLPGQVYSVGHHPWNGIPRSLNDLARAAAHPQVVAIGETGLDALRGAPLGEQIDIFKQHIAIAQQLGKPVIAHMVRTSQALVKAWREMSPRGIALIIHGMRGNANVARQLIDAGCYLSYGAHFNPAALLITPPDRILAETDESPVPVGDIIAAMASATAMPVSELTYIIKHNAASAMGLQERSEHT